MFRYFHYITTSIIIGILAIFANYLNFVAIQSVLGLFYVLMISFLYGKTFFGKKDLITSTILGLFTVICLIMVIGTAFFYLYALNIAFIISMLVVFPAVLMFYDKIFDKKFGFYKQIAATKDNMDKKYEYFAIFSVVVYTILSGSLVYILKTNSTSEAVRSVWSLIPQAFFIIYLLASLVLITVLLGKDISRKINYKLVILMAHLFLSSSVLYFIFGIGFGFDPFIHRATLDIISETGTILPKPFYYIGQYSLEFFIHKFFGLSLFFIDNLLLVFLSSLLLPAVLYNYLSKKIADKKNVYLILLSFFIFLPIGFTLFTTPQNLANLFIVVLIILALCFKDELNYKNNSILVLSGLAILTIHPLSGLPAIMFLSLFFLWSYFQMINKKILLYLFLFFSLLGTALLPTIWLLNAQISSQAVVSVNSDFLLSIKTYLQNFSFINFKYQGQFSPVFSLVYFIYFNFKLLFSLIIIFTIFKLILHKKLKNYIPYFFTFLILIINYFLLKFFLEFDFLISYEKQSYTDRVLQISLFFLIPFILIFLKNAWSKIFLQKKVAQYLILIFLALTLSGSFYLTYPRHDNFVANGGFNVAQSDILAVRYIEENSTRDFIVLANQQVSAGALSEYGFKKYYQTVDGEMFYYPIPTGGTLYQYYLKMVNEKPSRENMVNAMNFMGVDESYFIINRYWWNFDRIVEWSKIEADEYQVIEGGQVYIFKFTL